MIFISFLFFVVGEPLAFLINSTDHMDLVTISPIILLDAAVCFYTCLYSVIGSGIGIYSGLFVYGIRSLRLYVSTSIFTFICLILFVVYYILYYLRLNFHQDYMENICINPFYFLGFDLISLMYLDISSFYVALLFPISYSNDYSMNFISVRNFSINKVIFQNKKRSVNNLNNDLDKFIGGGYTSYKNVISLGFLIELLENKPIFVNKLRNYLENLDDQKTYTFLPVFRWIDDITGFSRSITIADSMKLNKFVDIDLLADKLSDYIIKALYRYDVNNYNTELILMNRVWLDINDFNVNQDEMSSITNNLNKILSKKKINKEDLIRNRFANIENDKFNKIIMDNYGTPLSSVGLITDYRLNENQYIKVKKLNEKTNFITVKNIDNSDQNLITWKDTKTDFGFIRNISSINYFFNHLGEIFKTEGSYNFLDYPMDNKNDEQDFKIGAIDFETFGDEGMGYQNVYAAGWAVNDSFNSNKFYYINQDGNSLEVVKKLIYDLANNTEMDGYTFYAHNLGRFDSVFLIKTCILLENIEIIPKWKDNKILSLTIKNIENKCKFKILDSIQLINGSLDSLCKSFKISIQKGIFPHNFVNKDRLFYIGKTPDHIYFKYMDINQYNKMKSNNWDLKSEALIYLKKDVFGLLQVMLNFNEKIFNMYSLNITNYVTAAKLAVGIYTSNFITNSNDWNIKMIRGNVEKDIRSSYYGGNVNVFINKIDHGYYYDMNSQYPFAMLNDMPIGNPILSNDTNLDNYFGFVYGEITAPDYNTLRVPYIQMKDENSDITNCPRGTFSRMIFSEEIKQGLKDGYTMKVKYGYKFERGKNLFKDYVETMYDIKKNTNDPVERAMSKLLLNSLYGKFGMRDITSTMKIVDKDEAKKITKDYNYSLFADLSPDKVLIKYSSKLPEPLRKLVKDNDDKEKKNINYLEGLSRTRGVPSAVHISAAISAYARMSINNFKNIPGNPCVYSDTDSVVLTKPLQFNTIGKELGQMKLEHEIKQGIFIRKKLYAIIDNKGNEIIKSSGVNTSALNFDKFKLLLIGNSIKCTALSFKVIWKDLNIEIVNRPINLQGLKTKFIDIKDHYDINFKQIIPYNPPSILNNCIINSIKNIYIKIIEIPYRFNPYFKIIWLKLLRLYQYIFKQFKFFDKYFK